MNPDFWKPINVAEFNDGPAIPTSRQLPAASPLNIGSR